MALEDLGVVVSKQDLLSMMATVEAVFIAPALKAYLVDLAAASRRHPALALGISPRATLQLSQVARSRAAASGRDFVVPDDLHAIAAPTLAHRLVLRPARTGQMTAEEALDEILRMVPVPAGR